MTDEFGSDSGLRRRAALLLLMLAVVAVLFVVVLSVLLDSGGSGGGTSNNAGPDDTLVASPGATSTSAKPTSRASTPRTSSSRNTSSSTSSGPSTKSCPTQQTCALRGDYGRAIDAINAYRAKNGQKKVPGRVSKAAQDCARNNGSGCSGGWAETQVPAIDGEAAVQKISKLGKLLDPGMKSFEVGWAYSPQAKQYYFAIVRNS